MIVVVGYITIDPAKRTEIEAAIAVVVTATTAEDGNIDYRYSHDVLEANRINIVELWESEDAMNFHMGTQHLADFMTVAGGAIAGPVEIVRHDISSSTKIF